MKIKFKKLVKKYRIWLLIRAMTRNTRLTIIKSLSLTSTCIIMLLEYNLLTLFGRLFWGTWWFYRDKRWGFKRIKIRIVLNTNKISLNVLLRFMSKFVPALKTKSFFVSIFLTKKLDFTKTIIPLALMASVSIAHSTFGLLGYWLRGHKGKRNNC